MREILFRGKAINRDKGYHRTKYKNGEWVYGLLTKLYDERFETLPAEMRNEDGIEGLEIDYKTIGQFTGLTDKHGNRIFEGDIIKQEYALNGKERAVISVIEYGISYAYSDVCGVFQRFSDGSGTAMLSVGGKSGLVYCEIIGNIHDNPDLMKGGAE